MANPPNASQPPPLKPAPKTYLTPHDTSHTPEVSSASNIPPTRGLPTPTPPAPVPAPPVGPNWLLINWGSINISQGHPTGTFLANTFTVAAVGTGNLAQNDSANCSGTLTYNGPSANCNVHLVVSATGADIGDAVLEVFITQDVNPVADFLVEQLPNMSAQPPGTYNVSFSLADTGGNPSSILVEIIWHAGNFMVGPGTVNGTGTITNV